MILVHDIFICKPGNASKLAKKFKDAMGKSHELVNILTDMTGQYNRVVIMVSQYENLTDYEHSWEKMQGEHCRDKTNGRNYGGVSGCVSERLKGNFSGMVIPNKDFYKNGATYAKLKCLSIA